MTERRVSSPQEVKEKYQKVGVVIFILNKEGEVLVVQENAASLITGKEKGDFGVICEASEEGEGWEETVTRGLREELGIDPQKEESGFKIDPRCCFLGESLFVEGVLARVIIIHWRGEEDIFSQVADGEVSMAGWERPEDLLSYPLRLGVRKILEEALRAGQLGEAGLGMEECFLPLSVDNLRKAAEGL